MIATLQDVLAELSRHRELVFQLALRDIRIRYKQAVFGFLWAILVPLVVIGAGMIVRYAAAEMSGGQLSRLEIGGMAVKAVGWSFFTSALGAAVIALLANQNLITKIAFPREVLPIAAVLASGIDGAIGASAVAVLLPFLGVPLTPQILWAVPLAGLLILLTLSLSTILAAANLFFRDVKYIVQIALTFGVFFTPVIYEPAMLGPRGARLAMLNPVAPILEGLRLSVIQGHNLLEPIVVQGRSGPVLAWHPLDLGLSVFVAVVGAVGALLLYRRLTFVFAEYV